MHGLTGGAESLESHASQKVGTGSDVFELSTVQRTLGGRFGGDRGLLVRGSSCVLVPASSETNLRGGESSSSFWCEIGAGVPFFHYPRLLFFCRVLQAPPPPHHKVENLVACRCPPSVSGRCPSRKPAPSAGFHRSYEISKRYQASPFPRALTWSCRDWRRAAHGAPSVEGATLSGNCSLITFENGVEALY